MSCACSALPWRTFVRGLVQVHRLEGVVPAGKPRLRTTTATTTTTTNTTSTAGASFQAVRRFHETARWRSEGAVGAAAAAASAVETPEEVKSREKEEPRPETNEIRDEAPFEVKRIRKPKKERWSKRNDDALEGGDDAAPSNIKRSYGGSTWKTTNSTDSYQPSSSSSSSVFSPNPPENNNRKKPWQLQKEALKEKFPEGWAPRKRLSPDALAGIRALNAQFPEIYTTQALASKFKVSVEAIRRILKSKWAPATADEEQDRQDRWFRRGKAVWEQQAALGIKPPRRWRAEGVARDPGYHEWSRRVSEREREWEEEEVRRYRAYREKMKKGES